LAPSPHQFADGRDERSDAFVQAGAESGDRGRVENLPRERAGVAAAAGVRADGCNTEWEATGLSQPVSDCLFHCAAAVVHCDRGRTYSIQCGAETR